MMIPPVRRTWAPVGHTPVHRHAYRRDRISVIGGLSISPKRRRLGLYFRLHPNNISKDEVCDFLWYLLQHLRGQVIVVWDGAAIHDPKALGAVCRRSPRLHLERLPAYAPEFNPIEGIWHVAKWPLANGRPDDLQHLGRSVLDNLCRARTSQKTLRACVAQSALPPFLR